MVSEEYKGLLDREKKNLESLCINDMIVAVKIDLLLNVIDLLSSYIISEIDKKELKEQIELLTLQSNEFREVLNVWERTNGKSLKRKLLKVALI